MGQASVFDTGRGDSCLQALGLLTGRGWEEGHRGRPWGPRLHTAFPAKQTPYPGAPAGAEKRGCRQVP